mmetsp:Transcript_27287/g.70780  ORF Transcript_27287/g.70780 Transcript_27287/m.70780 type:complete len:103 (-) Transcript_27287:2333-2641(-)
MKLEVRKIQMQLPPPQAGSQKYLRAPSNPSRIGADVAPGLVQLSHPRKYPLPGDYSCVEFPGAKDDALEEFGDVAFDWSETAAIQEDEPARRLLSAVTTEPA